MQAAATDAHNLNFSTLSDLDHSSSTFFQLADMAPKKKSAWISNKELKQMTAGAALPPPSNAQQFDHGDKLNPHLFHSWGGEHAAPPIWDERPVYKNRDLQGTIRQWESKVKVEPRPFGVTSNVKGTTNFSFNVGRSNAASDHLYFLPPKHDESLMAELVPRSWIPQIFEPSQNLDSFWQNQMSGAPGPQHDTDFGNCRPFWELYLTNNSAVQFPPSHPDHKGCDTREDTTQDTEARKNEHGSQGWTNEYLKNPNALMMARFRRKTGPRGGKQYPDDRQKEPSFVQPEPMIDNAIKPVLNLFVRMATLGDIPQITDIYNHYVQNSGCTPELEPIDIIDMKGRWQSARDGHLPFLVACSLRGYGGKRRHVDRPAVDTVLGFAYADGLGGPRTALRFAVETGVFVSADPRWKRKGVSKCLMDKLLGLLDQYYIERGGYDIDERLGLGTQRVVSRIFVNFLNSEGEKSREWVIPYLESWGFQQQATTKRVGYKLNKVYVQFNYC
jgi:L-amino acid N-acyltransferase YncA